MALKNRTKLGDAVDNKLYEKFKEIHDETSIPRSRLLDQALELLLAKYGKSITTVDAKGSASDIPDNFEEALKQYEEEN